MRITPRIRSNICVNAHPLGCEAQVQAQVEAQEAPKEAPKKRGRPKKED